MIKHRKKPALTDLEVGSFSDIAFLLIIFFILTTQIVRLTGKTLEVPSGSESQSAEQKQDEKKQFMIHLTTGDKITTGDNSEPITLEELKVRLAEQDFRNREKTDDRFVILETQPDVTYELYFQVIMLIDDAGGYLAIMETDDGGPQKGAI